MTWDLRPGTTPVTDKIAITTNTSSGTSASSNSNLSKYIIKTLESCTISSPCEYIFTDPNSFKYIKEIVPNKVYSFTFADNTIIKTVCDEEDVFDLEYAFYLALAKKCFSSTYTFEGVLHQAKEIHYIKYYHKIVEKGMKLFKKIQKEEAKKIEQEEIKKRQHERYIEKKKKRDRRQEQEFEDQIHDIILKAIQSSKK